MKTILLAVLAISLIGFRPVDLRRAEADARRDIAEGQLILRSYGLAGRSAYSRLLEERYSIRIQVVAGCVVDSKIVAETAAYNAIMKAEIEKRFGAGVLESAAASASGSAAARDQ